MNVPKIRINGFEGEWKRIKLAECLNISNETNKDNVYVAIIGENLDGHSFINSAYENGCRTFIISDKN